MTHSHADCSVLVDRAPITMEDLKNLPDTANSQKSEHSTIAFIELSIALDDPFDSFSPPDSQPLDRYDATKPCYLFAIPRELRDMISDYTISIGGIQILQTSKKFREEGTRFLYKRRVCHLDLDFTGYVPKFSLQKPVAALIQNVNIDITLDFRVGPFLWIDNMKPISKFVGAIIPRQTCRVMVLFRNYDYDGSVACKAVCFLEWIMNHIRALVGFSHLILQYEIQMPMTVSERPAWSAEETFLTDPAFHKKYLGSDLGPCTRHDIEDSRRPYFEFHPRGNWEASPGSLSAGTQRLIDRWTGNTRKKHYWVFHGRAFSKQRLR